MKGTRDVTGMGDEYVHGIWDLDDQHLYLCSSEGTPHFSVVKSDSVNKDIVLVGVILAVIIAQKLIKNKRKCLKKNQSG